MIERTRVEPDVRRIVNVHSARRRQSYSTSVKPIEFAFRRANVRGVGRPFRLVTGETINDEARSSRCCCSVHDDDLAGPSRAGRGRSRSTSPTPLRSSPMAAVLAGIGALRSAAACVTNKLVMTKPGAGAVRAPVSGMHYLPKCTSQVYGLHD